MSLRAVLCALLILMPPASPGPQSPDARTADSLATSFPGKSWEVRVDSPGFAIEVNGPKADGRQYLVANNSKTGLVLSITLEKTDGPADASTCPAYLEKRAHSLSGLGLQDIKASTVNSAAVIEYLIPKANGIPLRQKNFFLCSAKEDVFIDLHLSKVQFQPDDEALFLDVLNRVQIVDRQASSTPVPASGAENKATLQYLAEGSRFYSSGDLKNAIGPYQKALDLEKQQRQLSQNYWRVLVDNLGMAYGITGDLQHAEDTFNYGVSQDPAYPLFYYNLGCVAAERGDMHKTMDFLGKAFARKANSIPGEEMPDPRKDDSFQRFMSNGEFRKFADSLESSK